MSKYAYIDFIALFIIPLLCTVFPRLFKLIRKQPFTNNQGLIFIAKVVGVASIIELILTLVLFFGFNDNDAWQMLIFEILSSLICALGTYGFITRYNDQELTIIHKVTSAINMIAEAVLVIIGVVLFNLILKQVVREDLICTVITIIVSVVYLIIKLIVAIVRKVRSY